MAGSLALSVLGLGVAGCGETSPSSSAVGSEPGNRDVIGPGLVASDYPVNREWRERIYTPEMVAIYERIWNEESRRVEDCMHRRGFDDYRRPVFLFEQYDLGRTLNPLNEDVAKSYGYHVPPIFLADATEPLSPDEFEALMGSGDGQTAEPPCSAAIAPVSQASADFVNTLDELLAVSLDAYVSSFGTTAQGSTLIAQWSQCMKDAGFDYSDPLGPLGEFGGAEEVTSDELRTREADLACNKQVGLTVAESEWGAQRFEEWRATNAGALAALPQLIADTDAALREVETEVFG